MIRYKDPKETLTEKRMKEVRSMDWSGGTLFELLMAIIMMILAFFGFGLG